MNAVSSMLGTKQQGEEDDGDGDSDDDDNNHNNHNDNEGDDDSDNDDISIDGDQIEEWCLRRERRRAEARVLPSHDDPTARLQAKGAKKEAKKLVSNNNDDDDDDDDDVSYFTWSGSL